MTSIQFTPIGHVECCFKEKFGVARQSLMQSEARGVIKMLPEISADAFEHIEGFSHLWIIFVFHKNLEQGWRPQILPPRIDGPERVGVFASRSPHRPNPVRLSCVKLDRIDLDAPGGIEIHVSGLDVLDGSPVIDLKPYLAFADSIPQATSGWASAEIEKYPLSFSAEALKTIEAVGPAFKNMDLKTLLVQMLELDPRPASQRKAIPLGDPQSEGRRFAFRLQNLDVQWQIKDKSIWVTEIISLG